GPRPAPSFPTRRSSDLEERDVAAVVDDELRALAAGERNRLQRTVPIFLERLALPGKHRRARLRDRGGRVILGREDVAGRPAHVRSEEHTSELQSRENIV